MFLLNGSTSGIIFLTYLTTSVSNFNDESNLENKAACEKKFNTSEAQMNFSSVLKEIFQQDKLIYFHFF